MTARIVLAADTCVVSGMCESVAPDLFEIDDDGDLQVLQPEPPADRLEVARQAARSCPTRALKVVEPA